MDILDVAIRINNPGTPLKRARIVRKCPILPASYDFSCLGVNRHQSAARKRTDVRFSHLIQSRIPAYDTTEPLRRILENVLRHLGQLVE